jgi:hypothetical protein
MEKRSGKEKMMSETEKIKEFIGKMRIKTE